MNETIEYLRKYNEWRRGADTDMPEPEEIGKHIDAAITQIQNGSKYSGMLSRICGIVQEFAENEEDTTLMCVARLRAKYYDSMSLDASEFVQKLEREQEGAK